MITITICKFKCERVLAVPGLIIFKHQLASVAVGISCMGLLGEIQDFYPIPAVPVNPALSVIRTYS